MAKECVELGLQQVKPWGHLGDVAQAIQDHAKENGYSVVRQVGGHGIGLEFHEAPYVSYVIKKGTGMVMARASGFLRKHFQYRTSGMNLKNIHYKWLSSPH